MLASLLESSCHRIQVSLKKKRKGDKQTLGQELFLREVEVQ